MTDRRARRRATARRRRPTARSTVEAGVTDEHRPRRRSSPIPTPTTRCATPSTGRPQGVVTLGLDGANVQASASIDRGEQTDSFPLHRHRRRRRDGVGDGRRSTVTPPSAPPPQARADAATTNQGQAGHRRRARQRHRPARPGPHASSSVGAVDGGTAATDGAQVTFTPAPDFFGPTSFIYRVRDGANIASRESEAQVAVTVIGQPSAPGSPIAVAGNATATVNWAAPPSNGAPIDDYEIRIGEGEAAVGRQPDRLHVDRADQRRSRSRSASAPTTAPAGVRGAARRPSSRPTSSPAGRRRRPCSSPTARSSCRGRRRPTRAARSPPTTCRSAAAPRPSSASARRRRSAGRA